jgi:hypothetical protein
VTMRFNDRAAMVILYSFAKILNTGRSLWLAKGQSDGGLQDQIMSPMCASR